MGPKIRSRVVTYSENQHNGPQLCPLLIFPAPTLNILRYLVKVFADGLTFFSHFSPALRWWRHPRPPFPPSATRPRLCSSASAPRTWPVPWQSSALRRRRCVRKVKSWIKLTVSQKHHPHDRKCLHDQFKVWTHTSDVMVLCHFYWLLTM